MVDGLQADGRQHHPINSSLCPRPLPTNNKTASVDGHKAAAAVVRNPETGRLELRLAQGFAKASGKR